MKRLLTNKTFITFMLTIISLIILLTCCSCNYQVIDLDYDYDKIVCYYGDENFELKIDKWTDYEGEQLQIKSDGKTYLLSANNCYMIKE